MTETECSYQKLPPITLPIPPKENTFFSQGLRYPNSLNEIIHEFIINNKDYVKKVLGEN